MRNTLNDRNYDSFVTSRLRPGNPNSSAVEVIIGNAGDISGGGGGSSLGSKNWLNEYQESLAVVNGITTSILTHTFSSTNASMIYSVSASGENISVYELFIDSVLIEKKRTYFGTSMDVEFNFNFGFAVGLGSVLELKVFHTRTNNGDYNATLKYAEDL